MSPGAHDRALIAAIDMNDLRAAERALTDAAKRAALAQHVVNAVSQFEQLRVAERFDKIDQSPLERVQGLFGQAALKGLFLRLHRDMVFRRLEVARDRMSRARRSFREIVLNARRA